MNEKEEKVYMRLVKLLSSMIEDRDKTIMDLKDIIAQKDRQIEEYTEITKELMKRLDK